MAEEEKEISAIKKIQCNSLIKAGYGNFEEDDDTEKELNYLVQAEQLQQLITIKKLIIGCISVFALMAFVSVIAFIGMRLNLS